MAVALTGLFGDLANLVPTQNDILQSVAAGAAGTVVLAGLKSSEGQSAIDPLNLFHHPAVAATSTAPATPAVSGLVTGPVMTMSQYNALSADGKATVTAMKYTIIPG